ncbi:hypothetical protein CCM_04526 [Cordyceps militaris CM01]|uniref:Mediator of RNA polymerase II transcription subunit 13 n=1 Tax=Cordyceps militaris (strain CM01) TaxID=983644 RepID=G3JFG4_CORMM|nr:uncharacterized protein CCM_04526 [Cordyceps militaris CM01]EGX93154.1 hypothetical protein CCM_04526 [Cordyceps militaris CM01]
MDTVDVETNVLLVNNIASFEYRFYEPSADSEPKFSPNALEIETNLREQGHVVSFDATRRGLWYFRIRRSIGPGPHAPPELGATIAINGQSLVSSKNGVMEPSTWHKALVPEPNHQKPNPASSGQATHLHATGIQLDLEATSMVEQTDSQPADGYSPKVLYEAFVGSLLLTISSRFCARSEAVPLNFRTVLLPALKPLQSGTDRWIGEQAQSLGTLTCYMISTGSLILSFSVTACPGLASLQDILSTSPSPSPIGNNILAAPFGVMTNEEQISPSYSTGANPAHTPNAQALAQRSPSDVSTSLWKQACLSVLELRGVPSAALRDCSWVNLLVSKPKLQDARPENGRGALSTISIPWPGSLCFRKKSVELSATNRISDTIGVGHDETHDPLGDARGWLSSANDREERVSKRHTERSAAGAKETLVVDSRVAKVNAPSPVTMRRPSTTGGNAVYPTPPDAIQHLNGVTPSMDGNLSSPGHPLSVVADVDIDCEPPGGVGLMPQHEDEMTDAAEAKPLRSDNSLLSDAENMFEDMGGDMFGDNDITEDDFNFFDEQPDELGMDITLDSIKEATASTATMVQAEVPHVSTSTNIQPATEQVVFAKPELKHARSSQPEDGLQRGRDIQAKSVKRGSSPFDPDSVFKRLRAAASQQSQRAAYGVGSNRGHKIFGKVAFDLKMPMLNKKYEHGGFFDFVPNDKDVDKLEPGTLPKTDYLRRHGKTKAKTQNNSRRSSLVKSGNDSDLDHRLLKLDGDISDGDDSSSDSDTVSNLSVKEPISPVKSTVKQSLLGDDDAASHATTSREPELAEEPDEQLALELPRLSLLDGPDTSLFKYFTDPEPLSLDISLSDEDMIQVAQLVGEQAATGSLLIFNGQPDIGFVSAPDEDTRIEELTGARSALQALRNAASCVIEGVSPVSLKALLEIQDNSLPGPGNRIPPRQIPSRDPNSEPIKPSNLYQIPCPHLEVRRADVKMSLLPTAVTFWENLGLSPSSGSKDIHAVCVCPKWAGMVDNAQTFLGRMKSAYETLKLGTFENLPLSADMDDGVLLYGVDRISTAPDAAMMGHGSALLESMETLSGAMSTLELVDTNVVVYFMYSTSNPGTIVEACMAFQRFFESYRRTLSARRESAKNEIVLQLVSADAISSPTHIVVTRSSELNKLCMETYDRCTLFGGNMPAPAIRLEQPLPRIIDFKLSPAPSSSLARENSCIHIAYARSIDGRWVTAAWTDDRGNEQATAAYCLGRKGEPESRTMNDVAHEIWETTVDLISTWKVHYRIIMTKCGPTDDGEIDFWVDLARTEINASVTMIIMTVDTNPSLQLVPAPVKMPLQPLSIYTTPVSTPQANIVSPDASAAPATPARDPTAAAMTPGGESTGDADPDSVLADVMDQTWGAIVNHRLNNTVNTANIHPTLISGYLIKRTGPRAEDVPRLIEVNLVYTEATARTYEPLLREMLSYFRGLGTLARARGVVDGQTDVRPWHVAAAEKALRALYILM